MMRRAILPILITVAGIAPFVAFFMWLFADAGSDVDTAREFLHLLAAEEHGAATELMSPALLNRMSSAELARRLGDLETWDSLRFPSRSFSTNPSGRTTQISGTGTTITGCQSSLNIRLIDGRVDMFNITPLCPAQDIEV